MNKKIWTEDKINEEEYTRCGCDWGYDIGDKKIEEYDFPSDKSILILNIATVGMIGVFLLGVWKLVEIIIGWF